MKYLLASGYGLPSLAADFVVLALIALNIYLGYRSGLVRRAISLVAVFGAAVSAYNVGNPVAGFVSNGSLMANGWSFVGIFAIVLVMIEILSALYAERLDKIVQIAFDRIAGAVAGLIVGVLEVAVIFSVAIAVGNVEPTANNGVPYNHAEAKNAIESGVLSQLIVKLEPGVTSLLRPAIPSDLEGHLAEGIANTGG